LQGERGRFRQRIAIRAIRQRPLETAQERV
jgi:hypothetical protein